MKQERVPVEKLREIIEDRVSITSLLKKIDID
jgi:glycine--tRNA ligase